MSWYLCYLLLGIQAAPAADKIAADLLVRAGRVVTMDAGFAVYEPGAVAVAGTRIVAVGTEESVRARVTARETIDAGDGVVMPGLVNTHTHIPMTFLRAMTDGLPLEQWLTQKMFPAEKIGVTIDSVRWATRLGLAEMIQSGTTTFCDMYYFEPVIAEETIAAGMRAMLGSTVIGFPVADATDPDVALEHAEAFLERYKEHPLITPAVAPHSVYTVSGDVLKKCRALANRFHAPLVIHLSESMQEVADVKSRTGKRPLELAESLGLFEGRIVAAHVVHATPDEIAVLARRGVGVAHCPESNMKLGSGIAPVRAQLAAGLAVGLGTDGAASNDDLNLFEEIDTAAKLQKVAALDPTALDGKTALAMATIIGARCLGLADRIGSLEVGKEADLIAVGGDRAGLVPHGDVYGYLAYVVKGSDVRHVLVAGRVLLRDGKLMTIDAPAAEREVAAWRAKVDSQLAK